MMIYLFNILEQFDLYVLLFLDTLGFWVLIFCFYFLFILVFMYDISLGTVFFICFIICLSFFYNTTDFISCVIFYMGVWLYWDCMYPVWTSGHFIIAVISDAILSQTQMHLGGKLNTYYFFLVGTAVILGLCNLFGIMPWSKALTAHFVFAFYFSLSYFIVNCLYGMFMHSVKIFNLFLANDIPLFIMPLLICMEAISFFSRIFSLAISLFANLVAGHILLKMLMVFLWKMLEVHFWFNFPTAILYLGVLIIMSLEVVISILQVYIFNMLLIIYMNNIAKLH